MIKPVLIGLALVYAGATVAEAQENPPRETAKKKSASSKKRKAKKTRGEKGSGEQATPTGVNTQTTPSGSAAGSTTEPRK